MKDLVRVFQSAANPNRLRILNLLAHADLCGRDVERLLGLPQPYVSHHLTLLRQAKLVRPRRDGLRVCYSLARSQTFTYPLTAFLHSLLPFTPVFQRDLQKLEEYWDQGRLKYRVWLDPLGGVPTPSPSAQARVESQVSSGASPQTSGRAGGRS